MLLDEHRERGDEHRVELTGHTLGKTGVVRGNHAQLLVLHPLFEGDDVLRHVPHLLHGAATLDVERVEDVLRLGADGGLVGDVVGDGPHLLPVELLRVDEQTVVEVRLVDVQVHHAGVRTAYLCDVRVAETAAHLGGAAPVLNLALHLGVATLDDAGDDRRALAGTVQVGHHLADGTAGVQLAEPCGDVGLRVVGCQLLLHVHDDHGDIEVAHGGQHIIRGAVGEHLQDDEVDVGGAELVASLHRLLLRGHHAAVDNLDRRRQRLLERLVLSLKLRDELWELRQVCLQCNGEHAYACLRLN